MEKHIKIWEGIRIHTATECIDCTGGAREVWETFNWDIDNDPAAKECADIIIKHLFCFGFIDLTEMNHGKYLALTVIPVKDPTIFDNKED